jgi:hypothetical protein
MGVFGDKISVQGSGLRGIYYHIPPDLMRLDEVIFRVSEMIVDIIKVYLLLLAFTGQSDLSPHTALRCKSQI